MSAFENLKRKRLMEMVKDSKPFEEIDPPHGEEQPIIDHLERPVYDGDPDYDDLYDDRMDLGYDDDE